MNEHMSKEILQKLDKLVSRVDVLIYLALRQQADKQKLTMRERIHVLSSLGLYYKDIARIFGKSDTYIASELTQLKKKAKKKE